LYDGVTVMVSLVPAAGWIVNVNTFFTVLPQALLLVSPGDASVAVAAVSVRVVGALNCAVPLLGQLSTNSTVSRLPVAPVTEMVTVDPAAVALVPSDVVAVAAVAVTDVGNEAALATPSPAKAATPRAVTPARSAAPTRRRIRKVL
jgi:hypothetical protein